MLYNERGITLIEVSITLAIVMIIAIPTARYFNLQSKNSMILKNQLEYRSEAERFISKFTWELKQAKKSSIVIVDVNGVPEEQGTAIGFTYDHHVTGNVIQSTYTYQNYEIWRTRDSGSGPFTKKLIDRIQEVELVNGNPIIFTKKNSESYIDTVYIAFAPYNRAPLKDGSKREIVTTMVTARN